MKRIRVQTRLESFMRKNEVKPAHLAHRAHISRQHLLRLRKGEMAPTLPMMVRITDACGALLGRTVKASELFHGLA